MWHLVAWPAEVVRLHFLSVSLFYSPTFNADALIAHSWAAK